MSNKDIQTDEPMVDVGSAISKSEKFFIDNKKALSTAGIALIAISLIYIFYQYKIVGEASKEAAENLWKTEKAMSEMKEDSLKTLLAGNKDVMGFEEIAAEYGNTEQGNLAHYYSAILLIKEKKYNEAIEHLEDFDADGKMLPHLKNGLLGDCYSELNETDKAIKKYVSAAKGAGNVLISPYFLTKAAVLSEQIGDFESAVSYYEEINSQYYTDPMKHAAEKQKVEKALGIVKAKASLKAQ
ncbi:MAG: tetratricopeptide repeat protein [Flavobacteriales bacterium]